MPRRSPADPLAREVGRRIRELRHQRGETLEALSERLDGAIEPRHIGELERGWHQPTLRTTKQLAEAFGLTLSDLFRDL